MGLLLLFGIEKSVWEAQSIFTANVEVEFDSDCSTVMKRDSRCRHTYVYLVHKVSLLSTTLQAVYSKDISIKKWQRDFLGALPSGSSTFEHCCGERQTRF